MATAAKEILKLTEPRVRGPSPSYDRAQFLLSFLLIGNKATIGRAALARSSGLGGGAVRTVLRKLTDGGYVTIDPSGCHLTPSGNALHASLRRRLSDLLTLEDTPLTMGRFQVALVVRGGGPRVTGGIEQRDSAVRAGATGATTYTITRGKFAVPGGSTDCQKDFPSGAWARLRSELKPSEGDAVILCGSSDELKATLGALSAALTLF